MKRELKKYLKVTAAILAVFIVFNQVDTHSVLNVLKDLKISWIVLALMAFATSQIISSFRLNVYFHLVEVCLTERENLKLYLKGMFYNLFLPGGLGGDAYKVFYLKKINPISTKLIVSTLVNDRISGLVALVLIAILLSLHTTLFEIGSWALILILIMLIPCYYMFTIKVFPKFRSVLKKTLAFALIVQLLQLATALFIIKGLGITELYVEYLILFLISSIAAALPISIGGIGIRELVLIFGAQFLGVNPEHAVTLGLVFFLLTTLLSFFGFFVKLEESNHDKSLACS